MLEKCPQCNSELKIVDDKFAGCSNWPMCKFSRQLEEEELNNLIDGKEEIIL